MASMRRADRTPAPAGGGNRLGFASPLGILGFGSLLLFFVLSPWAFSDFWAAIYDYSRVVFEIGLVAVLLFICALYPAHRGRRLEWITVLLLGFSLVLLAAFVTGVATHDGAVEVIRVAAALWCFLICRQLLQAGSPGMPQLATRCRWLLLAVCVGMAAQALYALWDYSTTHNPRQFGTFFNPNVFACGLAVAAPLALVALDWGRAGKGLFWTLQAVLLGGLLVTSSKGGLLAWVAGWAMAGGLVLAGTGGRLRLGRGWWLGALVAVVLIGVVGSGTILPRLRQAASLQDNSTMFRRYTWAGAAAMAGSRPWLGWGPASFLTVSPRFTEVAYTRAAHQTWLQLWAEEGIFALALVAGALLASLVIFYRHRAVAPYPAAAGAGAVTAFAVHGLTDTNWVISSLLLMLMVVLAVAAALADTEAPEPPAADRAASTHHLGYLWLVAALAAALGGWWTGMAMSAEQLRDKSLEFLVAGSPQLAWQQALAAVQADPSSARMWALLGDQTAAGGGDPVDAYQTAVQLQPQRSGYWLNLARVAEQRHQGAAAEKFFGRALACNPRDTGSLLERGQWRLQQGNPAGWEDLRRIAALAAAPYGRYQPLEQFVNLDFARAYVALVQHGLKVSGFATPQEMATWVTAGLRDIRSGRENLAFQQALAREATLPGNLAPARDLDELAWQLKQLQKQLGPIRLAQPR